MKKINDVNLIDDYIKKFEIEKIFEEQILKSMELFEFCQGELIYAPGEDIEYFYFLVKGKLKILFNLSNGRRLLLRFSNPFSIIGDVEVSGKLKVKTEISPVDSAYLLALPKNLMREKCLDNPKFLNFLVENLSYKLYTTSNSMALNLSYPLKARFASYLISISSDEFMKKRVEEIRSTKLTEISEILGCSYRQLSRVIKKLKEEKIISFEDKKITIEDFEKLKNISGELYE